MHFTSCILDFRPRLLPHDYEIAHAIIIVRGMLEHAS